VAARFYFSHPVDGTVELTAYIDRKVGWTLQERAEEGMPGTNTIIVADPEMVLDITGLRRFWVIEDTSEATDDVLFGGYILSQKISRGRDDAFQPLGRVWALEVADFNSVWNRRVMIGSDNDRPDETDVARVQWLLSTAETGIFDDETTYVHTGSTVNMDEGDYTGQYRDQVLDDCAQASGKNWWCKLIETGAGREVFVWYGHDGETDYASDLYLSNDPDDWAASELADGTSIVWPYAEDTELNRDPSRQYSGAYLEYQNGAVYRTKAATITDIGRRDAVVPAGMVKTSTKAAARATRYLNKQDDQDEVITTRVRLPAAKATMIRAGMRLPFKATHLPDYEEFTWTRVLACTIESVQGGSYYDLGLELCTDGVGADAPPAPPYDGEAVAALIGWYSEPDPGVATMSFLYTGDNAGGGYAGLPTIGPLTPVEGTAPAFGITADAAMTVRISAEVWVIGVASAYEEATLEVRVNGAVVGSQTLTDIWDGVGIDSVTRQLLVDVNDVTLAAGDVVTMTTDFANDGFQGSFGDHNTVKNSSMLIVGRGTHSNVPSGSVYGTVWTGP
jgi:hypothetical protein